MNDEAELDIFETANDRFRWFVRGNGTPLAQGPSPRGYATPEEARAGFKKARRFMNMLPADEPEPEPRKRWWPFG